jgi:hypothetical protein
VPSNVPDQDTIYITWDDPYIGENSYGSTAPYPYNISGGSILDYEADNDSAVFSLSFQPQIQSSTTTPALAYFAPGPLGSQVVLAFVATDGTNDLYATTTDTLDTWSKSNPVTGQSSLIAPALTYFDSIGQLVLAYVAANGSFDLLVSLSKDAVNWSHSAPVTGQSTSVAPAITAFGDKLIIAYVANNGSNDLLVTTSTDGVHWGTSKPVAGPDGPIESARQSSPYSPAITAMNGKLFLAYVADNGSYNLFVTTSQDGVTWEPAQWVTGQSSGMAPALAAFGNQLVMAYIANNGSQEVFTTVSADGSGSSSSWTSGNAIAGPQTSWQTPALTAFLDNVVLAFTASGAPRLIVVPSADGIHWQPSINVSGP